MRPSVILVAGACAGISVALLSLDRHNEMGEPASSAVVPATQPTTLAEPPEAAEIHAPAPPAASNDVRTVDMLQADTQSPDARTRADAIAELSRSSDPRAIAALRRVLDDGDPQMDQPLALQSLQKLAMDRGDDDGAIRETLRHTIHHATDESVIQSAQLLLEDLDARLASAAR